MLDNTWFALMTRPSSEEKAQTRLKDLGFATYYPHFPSYHDWKGKGSRYSRLVLVPKQPLLPGYMFVDPHLDGELRFDMVKDVPQVAALIAPPGRRDPVPIPPKAMRHIFAMTDPAGAVQPEASGLVYKSGKPKPRFDGKVGDMVRLKLGMGPWAGFEAAIKKIDPEGQISVEIQLFCRPTPLSVPFDECELIPKPKAG